MTCSAPRLALHLGEHHLFKEESTEQRIWAEKVIPHPQYDDVTYDNDFMLIKLMEPAVFNKYVQPIPLATSCSQPNAQCLVSGWGNQINSGGEQRGPHCVAKTKFIPSLVTLSCISLHLKKRTASHSIAICNYWTMVNT